MSVARFFEGRMTNHTPTAVEAVPRMVRSVMGSLNNTKAMMAVVGGVR